MSKCAIVLCFNEKVFSGMSQSCAYKCIKIALEEYGFNCLFDGVCTGTDTVKAVIAVQKLSLRYEWFKKSIKYVKLFILKEENDLMNVI